MLTVYNLHVHVHEVCTSFAIVNKTVFNIQDTYMYMHVHVHVYIRNVHVDNLITVFAYKQLLLYTESFGVFSWLG